MPQMDYCPVCKCDTLHMITDDEYFDFAVKCMECSTVWEAEPQKPWTEESEDVWKDKKETVN